MYDIGNSSHTPEQNSLHNARSKAYFQSKNQAEDRDLLSENSV